MSGKRVVKVIFKQTVQFSSDFRVDEIDLAQRDAQRHVSAIYLDEATRCVVLELKGGSAYLRNRKMLSGEMWVPLEQCSYVVVQDELVEQEMRREAEGPTLRDPDMPAFMQAPLPVAPERTAKAKGKSKAQE